MEKSTVYLWITVLFLIKQIIFILNFTLQQKPYLQINITN